MWLRRHCQLLFQLALLGLKSHFELSSLGPQPWIVWPTAHAAHPASKKCEKISQWTFGPKLLTPLPNTMPFAALFATMIFCRQSTPSALETDSMTGLHRDWDQHSLLPSTIPSPLPCAPCFYGALSNCSSAVGPSWSLNKKRKGWKPQFPCTLYNQHPKVAASHLTMTLALAGHLRWGTCYTIFCPNYAIWIWPRFPSLTLPLWPKQPLKWPSQPVLRPKQPQWSGASNHWAKRKREKKISMTLVKISSRASIREMSFYGRRQAENRKAVPQEVCQKKNVLYTTTKENWDENSTRTHVARF